MSTSTPEPAATTDDAVAAALAALPTSGGAHAAPPEPADDAGADDAGADELGDAGKQALDRMKSKLRDERTRRIAAERAAADKSDVDETERIRHEAETAANAKANARIIRAEIRALAAGRFADPADAVVFLDPADFDVDADGEVDRDAIGEALDALLAKKPHLSKPDPAAQGGARVPRPDRSQGASEPGTPSTAQQFEAAMRGRL